ncbi:hypothetical protein AMTRI_Chr02g262710 [Amborella trichopoda]
MGIHASSGNRERKGGNSAGCVQEMDAVSNSNTQLEKNEREARVNALWEQMNNNKLAKVPNSLFNKPNSPSQTSNEASPNWMVALGLASRKPSPTVSGNDTLHKSSTQNGTREEGKKIAAAALTAVKEVAAAAAAAAASSRGKIEISEVREFAGEEIEVKKLVDSDSKEAAEKAKSSSTPASGLDAILEQIKKKPKLSVLDKTKKDWGEFKENKGLEEELEVYKKSSNQYLDKVSFLQRADYREFERERDARLAHQAKRRADMREEP